MSDTQGSGDLAAAEEVVRKWDPLKVIEDRWPGARPRLISLIAALIAAERERCAKVVDVAGPTPNLIDLAAAIRARDTEKEPG